MSKNLVKFVKPGKNTIETSSACWLVDVVQRTASSRQTPVEVHADAEALPVGVLLRQREDERSQLTERSALMARIDAALRLTEEDHVGWQGEILVIFQRVPTK